MMKINSHDLVAEITEDLFAPEIFSSVVSQFSIASGHITIKLVSVRYDDSTAPPIKKAVVVGRVIFPILGAQALVTQLGEFLEAHGVGASGVNANTIVCSGPMQ